ncbi:hypothetical protein [Clavibacter zhangzhiyongii]|uniref:hypothetical protein n=1 Tax=Clavibacter zhangzhiyongii TaxID=2768071 RepID=UPI00195AAEAF|nr:hypothetical protein [Clavibacter zhangzhiyongii]MBM7026627.1 hypothetical protein [Clavibacter zhangzhiyongii]
MPSILAETPDRDGRQDAIRGLSAEASICYEVASADGRVQGIGAPRGSLVCLASVDS